MTKTMPKMHSINIVATVSCWWLVATTAKRSACSQRMPIKPDWHLDREAQKKHKISAMHRINHGIQT